MPQTGEVRYLVLADRAVPYLLARVRWPDVAQAISARSPGWLEDRGLFDLPYDSSAITVSFHQAASVAAGWGTQLQPGAVDGVLPYMRRMPANWSDLSPSERHAWGIEFAGGGRSSRRSVRRLRSAQAKMAASSTVRSSEHTAMLAGARRDLGASADGPASYGHDKMAHVMSRHEEVAMERRQHMRLRVEGRVHIRHGHTTVSAGMADLGVGGVRCVVPGAAAGLAPGAKLDGPFLLESGVTTWRVCLNVMGWICWQRRTATDTHFGVLFRELDEGEIHGVQRFLAAACSRRGSR
jgi:PilZ domain